MWKRREYVPEVFVRRGLGRKKYVCYDLREGVRLGKEGEGNGEVRNEFGAEEEKEGGGEVVVTTLEELGCEKDKVVEVEIGQLSGEVFFFCDRICSVEDDV